jgi:hypothetical protein
MPSLKPRRTDAYPSGQIETNTAATINVILKAGLTISSCSRHAFALGAGDDLRTTRKIYASSLRDMRRKLPEPNPREIPGALPSLAGRSSEELSRLRSRTHNERIYYIDRGASRRIHALLHSKPEPSKGSSRNRLRTRSSSRVGAILARDAKMGFRLSGATFADRTGLDP